MRNRPFAGQAVASYDDLATLHKELTLQGGVNHDDSQAEEGETSAGELQWDGHDLTKMALDLVRFWQEKDKQEFSALDGLLLILEHALYQGENYCLFDDFLTLLEAKALILLEMALPLIMDCDVRRGTTLLDTLLELLGMRQFMRPTSAPLFSLLLQNSPTLNSSYLRSSRSMADAFLNYLISSTEVTESRTQDGKAHRLLQRNVHTLFNDFHKPQRRTVVLHDDDFPIYTVKAVAADLARLGYEVSSPKRARDWVSAHFLRGTFCGISDDLTDADWLNALRMNFRFALNFARNCRAQDILWVQDLQFVFSGVILKVLCPKLHTTLFVECPFLASQESCGEPRLRYILQAMLGYEKIAFQTRRDCCQFRSQVQKLLPATEVSDGHTNEEYRLTTDNDTQTSVTFLPIGVGSEIDLTDLETRKEGSVVIGFLCGFDSESLGVKYLEGIRKFLALCPDPVRRGIDQFRLVIISTGNSEGTQSKFQQLCAEAVSDGVCLDVLHVDCFAKALCKLPQFSHIFHGSLDFKLDLLLKNLIANLPTCPKIIPLADTGLFQQFRDAGIELASPVWEKFDDLPNVLASIDFSLEKERKNGNICPGGVELVSLSSHLEKVTEFWSQTDLLCDVSVKSLTDFDSVMRQVRLLRLEIATAVLGFEKVPPRSVEALTNVADALQKGMNSEFSRRFKRRDSEETTDGTSMNVKDEVLTLQKDIRYLEMFKNRESFEHFVEYLAQPNISLKDPENFRPEVQECTAFLGALIKREINCFITDWDGTMKTYATSYNTCMQPAYSAIIIGAFCVRFTELSAVLTAGPLRATGILDLTCVPEDCITCWGGSWGQEWLISGKHRVNTEGLQDEAVQSLSRLADNLHKNTFSQPRFNHFPLVGSGFQRKVDRINLGKQTVLNNVDQATSADFVKQCISEVQNVDPQGVYLARHETDLDLEFVIKQEGKENAQFTKADGIDQCLKYMGYNLAQGTVLICGDTLSDVPMVERALKCNPENTHAIFVGPKPPVREAISNLLPSGRFFFASCPEVVHIAMAYCLMQPVVISTTEG